MSQHCCVHLRGFPEKESNQAALLACPLALAQGFSEPACSSSLPAAAAMARATRLGASSRFSESSSQLPPQFFQPPAPLILAVLTPQTTLSPSITYKP